MARCAALSLLALLAAPACTVAVQMKGDGDGDSADDVSSLKSSLESGGADELAKVLQTMQLAKAAQGNMDSKYHIRVDADGDRIYDFTQPKRPKEEHHEHLPMTTGPPTKLDLMMKLNKQRRDAQDAIAEGKPVPTVAPVAAVQPAAAQPAVGAPPLSLGVKSTQVTFDAPPPTFAVVGGQGQNTNQMEALTRGLETIRERIDSLAEEAVAAVQGGTMRLPQSSMPAAQAQMQQQATSGASNDKIEQEIEALSKRVLGLEDDNKALHKNNTALTKQLKDDDAALKAEKVSLAKDEATITSLQADDKVLMANVTNIMQHRRHLRKGAKQQAQKAQKAK